MLRSDIPLRYRSARIPVRVTGMVWWVKALVGLLANPGGSAGNERLAGSIVAGHSDVAHVTRYA